jgi:hypothetical protein
MTAKAKQKRTMQRFHSLGWRENAINNFLR